MRQSILLATFSLALATTGIANNKPTPPSINEAIRIVDSPSEGYGNMSPFELQVHYRLMGLQYRIKYKYREEDAPAWENCMLDEKRSMYARLSAAYFLLDQQEEARRFVELQLASKNLRHRYNAAEIVKFHVGRNPEKRWGIGVMVKLLADGSLDGSGVTQISCSTGWSRLGGSPPAEYPHGDEADIIRTPINEICWSFGFMKEKEAVPALISVLERRPHTGGAAFALGEIGDQRAIPILMKVLEDRSGYEDREITALGKLKHKGAVPILLSRLVEPPEKYFDWDHSKIEAIFEALLEIGDQRAIEPINAFLKGGYPRRSKAVAQRMLIQLKSPDPVKPLLALLETETYEPERSNIIRDLVKYGDRRVVEKLATLARTSDSAFIRRDAIFGLRDIGNRSALLALASLLDTPFPKDLKTDWGWKMPPDFRKYFPETIWECLKESTKQDLGKDRSPWEEWIKRNVEQEN